MKLLFVHSDEVDARQNLLKIRALVRMQINCTASRHSGNPHASSVACQFNFLR